MVLAFLGLVVAGCPPPDEHVEPRPPPPAAGGPDPDAAIATDRPETKQAILLLEGMEERFTFHLVRAPDFPIPFSTYLPEDMTAGTAVRNGAHVLRVVAEFGGRRTEDAFLEAFFYPARTTDAGARRRVRELAESRGLGDRRPEVGSRFDWSITEHDFARRLPDGTFVFGTIALGQREDRFFHVLLHYPEEFAEGFGPRADRILEEWRWEATGEFLGGASDR